MFGTTVLENLRVARGDVTPRRGDRRAATGSPSAPGSPACPTASTPCSARTPARSPAASAGACSSRAPCSRRRRSAAARRAGRAPRPGRPRTPWSPTCCATRAGRRRDAPAHPARRRRRGALARRRAGAARGTHADLRVRRSRTTVRRWSSRARARGDCSCLTRSRGAHALPHSTRCSTPSRRARRARDLEAVLDRFVQRQRPAHRRAVRRDRRPRPHGRSITFVRTGQPGALAQVLRDGRSARRSSASCPPRVRTGSRTCAEHPSCGFPTSELRRRGRSSARPCTSAARVRAPVPVGEARPFTAGRREDRRGARRGRRCRDRERAAVRRGRAPRELAAGRAGDHDDAARGRRRRGRAARHIASTAREVGGAEPSHSRCPGVDGELLVELASARTASTSSGR